MAKVAVCYYSATPAAYTAMNFILSSFAYKQQEVGGEQKCYACIFKRYNPKRLMYLVHKVGVIWETNF